MKTKSTMDGDQHARRRRAETQRILLIERLPEKAFRIAGLTNEYLVEWKDTPENSSCTCPDHRRRLRPCKHIYFVEAHALDQLEHPVGTKRTREDETDCVI